MRNIEKIILQMSLSIIPIYNLYEQRENREKLWHLSEKYCQRIEWHLYRLYRLRNAIVHAGESHKRIQMLGEHCISMWIV